MAWPDKEATSSNSNNKCILVPEVMEDNTKVDTMALIMEVILNSSSHSKEPTTWQQLTNNNNNNSNLVTINNNMEDIHNSSNSSSGILEVRARGMTSSSRQTGDNSNNTWAGPRESISGAVAHSSQTAGPAICLPGMRQLPHPTCTTTPSSP